MAAASHPCSAAVACAIGRREARVIRSYLVSLACGAASSSFRLRRASSGLFSAPAARPAWPIHVPRRASGPARSASVGRGVELLAQLNIAGYAEHSPAEPSHAPLAGVERLRCGPWGLGPRLLSRGAGTGKRSGSSGVGEAKHRCCTGEAGCLN